MEKRTNQYIEAKDSIVFFLVSFFGSGFTAFIFALGVNVFNITENIFYQVLLVLVVILLGYILSSFFIEYLARSILLQRVLMFSIIINSSSYTMAENPPQATILTFYERYISQTFVLLFLLFAVTYIWGETNTTLQKVYAFSATIICLLQYWVYRRKTSEEYLLSKVNRPFSI